MRPRLLLKFVALCASAMIVTPSLAQSGREWSKRTDETYGDGQLHAKWTYINTKDEQSPYLMRYLYKDQSGDLLVLRWSFDGTTGNASRSIEHMGTGELLAWDRETEDSIIIQLGTEAPVVIYYDDVVALYGPQGTEFPPDTKAAVSALIDTASQQFQDALRHLAIIGCTESAELHPFALTYAPLIYEDLPCVVLPTKKTDFSNSVADFDPVLIPPDQFEEQFGGAYYQ